MEIANAQHGVKDTHTRNYAKAGVGQRGVRVLRRWLEGVLASVFTVAQELPDNPTATFVDSVLFLTHRIYGPLVSVFGIFTGVAGPLTDAVGGGCAGFGGWCWMVAGLWPSPP